MKARTVAPLLATLTVAGVTLGLNSQLPAAAPASGPASAGVSSAATETTAAAESAAVSAIQADIGSFIPEQPALRSASLKPGRGLSSSVAKALSRKYSPSLLRQTRRSGAARIQKYFTGPALKKYSAQHDSMMRGLEVGQDPHFRPLAAGVEDVVWDSKTVDQDTATLVGAVTTWSRMAERHPQTGEWAVAEPHNRTLVRLTLVKVGNDWRVSNYEWEFLPGESP